MGFIHPFYLVPLHFVISTNLHQGKIGITLVTINIYQSYSHIFTIWSHKLGGYILLAALPITP